MKVIKEMTLRRIRAEYLNLKKIKKRMYENESF